MHFMANHDPLTGLANRALLNDRLAQAALHARRYDRRFTVAFIDVDDFKSVNDTLGHDAGDQLLKIIADRIVHSVRATDTVGRLGGDEFVVLLTDQPKDLDVIPALLSKITTAIAQPIRLGGRRLAVTCSVGAANYPTTEPISPRCSPSPTRQCIERRKSAATASSSAPAAASSTLRFVGDAKQTGQSRGRAAAAPA